MIKDTTKPKNRFKCVVCGEEGFSVQKRRKLCSKRCSLEFWGRKSEFPTIPTASVGSISVLGVCSKMLERGYCVFTTVSNASFCDVVAIKGKEVLLMEVRTGYLNTKGKLTFPRNIHDRVAIPTHYAVYIPKTSQMEIIPITNEYIEKYSESRKK